MKTAAVALLFSVSCAVMLSSADAAANVFFIHTDHLDTPRVVSDLAGNKVWIADYDAFGKATITSNTLAPYTSAMNVRFPGQYFDAETSTHYNYFRDYDPLIGRYLQSDPIGLDGGITTYAYVSNNPLRFIDPSGLFGTLSCAYWPHACVIGGGEPGNKEDSASYECETAPKACSGFTSGSKGLGNWFDCVRQCLQEKHQGRMPNPEQCSPDNNIPFGANKDAHLDCWDGCRRNPENPYNPTGPDLPDRDPLLY